MKAVAGLGFRVKSGMLYRTNGQSLHSAEGNAPEKKYSMRFRRIDTRNNFVNKSVSAPNPLALTK
jgi:hypothetical protein